MSLLYAHKAIRACSGIEHDYICVLAEYIRNVSYHCKICRMFVMPATVQLYDYKCYISGLLHLYITIGIFSVEPISPVGGVNKGNTFFLPAWLCNRRYTRGRGISRKNTGVRPFSWTVPHKASPQGRDEPCGRRMRGEKSFKGCPGDETFGSSFVSGDETFGFSFVSRDETVSSTARNCEFHGEKLRVSRRETNGFSP